MRLENIQLYFGGVMALAGVSLKVLRRVHLKSGLLSGGFSR